MKTELKEDIAVNIPLGNIDNLTNEEIFGNTMSAIQKHINDEVVKEVDRKYLEGMFMLSKRQKRKIAKWVRKRMRRLNK